jgi:hypothetical protein
MIVDAGKAPRLDDGPVAALGVRELRPAEELRPDGISVEFGNELIDKRPYWIRSSAPTSVWQTLMLRSASACRSTR